MERNSKWEIKISMNSIWTCFVQIISVCVRRNGNIVPLKCDEYMILDVKLNKNLLLKLAKCSKVLFFWLSTLLHSTNPNKRCQMSKLRCIFHCDCNLLKKYFIWWVYKLEPPDTIANKMLQQMTVLKEKF